MNECYLQVVYYFINFQLADTQFPLVCKIGKGIKIERKMGEIGLPLWPPFFLLGCYADVGENKIIFAGNQRTPADITILKIKRYWTGLIQGYNWYGGSG